LPTTRIWVSENRKILVTIWPDGSMFVALRDDTYGTWGPPIRVTEEKT
jgi:hypothetical protein